MNFTAVVKWLLILRGLWDHSDINSEELCMYYEWELFQIVAGPSTRVKFSTYYLPNFPEKLYENQEIGPKRGLMAPPLGLVLLHHLGNPGSANAFESFKIGSTNEMEC